MFCLFVVVGFACDSCVCCVSLRVVCLFRVCWLLFVGCWLSGVHVCGSLFVVGGWWLVTCRCLLLVVCRCSLFVVRRCSLLVDRCLLFVVC